MKRLHHPWDPVWREDARVLVLGTFPSVGSVKGGGYYGNPLNDFWRLMADALKTPWLAHFYDDPGMPDRYWQIGEDPVKATWAVRYTCLRMNGIALWDVVKSCTRAGPSSDGNLRDVRANDVGGLAAKLPDLELVAFTGQKAASLFLAHVMEADQRRYHPDLWDTPLGRTVTVWALPSPSRAHTRPYAEKLQAYRAALKVGYVIGLGGS